MTTITVQKRDMKVKAKKLRREGFVPGVICGKDIKEKMTIQIPEKEALRLIRENQKGEKMTLVVDGQTMSVIVKDYTYNAMKKQVEVLDFQSLVKGEKIHTSVEVILKNETMAGGVVTQELSEIPYRADSDHFIAPIVIDFETMNQVKTMRVSDLEAFKDPEVTAANPDSVIFSITKADEIEEEDEDTETAAE